MVQKLPIFFQQKNGSVLVYNAFEDMHLIDLKDRQKKIHNQHQAVLTRGFNCRLIMTDKF